MSEAQLDVDHSTRDAAGRSVRVLALSGQLDAHTYPTLEEELEAVGDDLPPRIVLEMSGLEYISSAGIGVVNKMANRFRDRQGDLRLAALPPQVDSVFKLLGFNRVLRLFATLDEAVASYQE